MTDHAVLGCVVRQEDGSELMVIPPRAMELVYADPNTTPRTLRAARKALRSILNEAGCYALYNPATRHIKLGKLDNPLKRVDSMQTGASVPLQLLMVWYSASPSSLEAHLHGSLSHARVRGEWYEASAVVRELPALQPPPERRITTHASSGIQVHRADVVGVGAEVMDRANELIDNGVSVVDAAARLQVPLLVLRNALLDVESGSALSSVGKARAVDIRRAASRETRVQRGLPATKPPKLSSAQRERLVRMYRNGEPVSEVAATFEVSRATVFRYVKAAS